MSRLCATHMKTKSGTDAKRFRLTETIYMNLIASLTNIASSKSVSDYEEANEHMLVINKQLFWNTYMKLSAITDPFESKLLIKESHQRNNILVENVCKGLSPKQRKVVEGIYKEFRPLIEASLAPDQIQQLFKGIEQSATAAGGNRTAIGQGKDVVAKANEVINNIGKWLQDTTPVQAFDQKFEDLKAKVSAKFPDVAQNLTAMGDWAKANPGKTAAIIGVLTALASLAGGPVGGAIAGQVLRGATELLKGEKLSTAVGKGIKTAALGYLSGKAFEVLGQYVGGMRADALPIPGAEESGLASVNYGATRTLSAPGFSSKEMVQGFNVAVFPQEQEGINAAMEMIKNGQPGGFDALQTIAREIRSADYKAAIKDIMAGARAEQLNNDSLMNWINGIAKAGQALSQGAVAASTGTGQQGSPNNQAPAGAAPTVESLRESQIRNMFYTIERKSMVISEGIGDAIKGMAGKAAGKLQQVGTNLTTKVTADKLMSAWKSAGSPTDSNAVAEILRKAGVSDDIINSTYTSMNIEAPAPAATASSVNTQDLLAQIMKLSPKEQQQVLAHLKK